MSVILIQSPAGVSETAVETIELAKAIGAPVINMHLAKGIYLTLPGRKEYLFKRYEEEYRRHIAEFGEMCRDAVDDAAIHMAVEIRKDLWYMRGRHWNFCGSPVSG